MAGYDITLPVVSVDGLRLRGTAGMQNNPKIFKRPCTSSDFNLQKEIGLYQRAARCILTVFKRPNVFELELAKLEHIPIPMRYTELYSNIVFTLESEYFCAGSGGPGGGKVFWTPYTAKDPVIRMKELDTHLDCDNCRVLAHELHHGIGGGAEFESFNSIPAAWFRIRNFPTSRIGWGVKFNVITMGAQYIFTAIQRGRSLSWERHPKLLFCALYLREPEYVRTRLSKEGFNHEQIKKIHNYIMKKASK